MLVIKRKPLESVLISDEIHVTILRSHHNAVDLGIDAPLDVPIFRREVYEAIAREQDPENGMSSRSERPEARSGGAAILPFAELLDQVQDSLIPTTVVSRLSAQTATRLIRER